MWILMLISVIVGLLIARISYETKWTRVAEVEVRTARLKGREEVKILQVTDLHNLALSDDVLLQLSAMRPDLIAITGDLIDGDEKDFSRVYRLIDALCQTGAPMYFCSGNNDWEHKRYREMLQEMQQRGVRVLGNTHTTLTVGDVTLNIAGVDDPHTRRDNLDKAWEGMEREGRFTLLLAHDPKIIRRELHALADLILSGHTHGGQIRFPFFGALVAPGQKLFPDYDKGIFPLKNGTILYIDSGLGTSRLPIRLLNQSQVTLLHVRGDSDFLGDQPFISI